MPIHSPNEMSESLVTQRRQHIERKKEKKKKPSGLYRDDQQGEPLPGRAVHGGGGGGGAAAKVLLNALVVSDLRRDRDRRRLCPRGDHGCRRRGGLRLPAEPHREDGGFQTIRRLSGGAANCQRGLSTIMTTHLIIINVIIINPKGGREEEQLILCCAASSLPLFLRPHWQVAEQKFSLADESCGQEVGGASM